MVRLGDCKLLRLGRRERQIEVGDLVVQIYHVVLPVEPPLFPLDGLVGSLTEQPAMRSRITVGMAMFTKDFRARRATALHPKL